MSAAQGIENLNALARATGHFTNRKTIRKAFMTVNKEPIRNKKERPICMKDRKRERTTKGGTDSMPDNRTDATEPLWII